MLNLLGATTTNSRSETGVSIRAIGAVAGITGGADEDYFMDLVLADLDALYREQPELLKEAV